MPNKCNMKKLFSSLCINFLLLMISDAVPLKLIPGDRSVVKKNGTTHTITKYYVVPNDLDLNKATNNTGSSLDSTIQVNESKYSKRMDLEATSEGQASEDKAEAANNQSDEYNVTVINKSVDKVAESLEAVNTQLSLEPETLGNLQVEPITNPYNLNNSVINETNVNIIYEGFQNKSTFFVDSSTQNIENNLQDPLSNLLLTKFGIAVYERAAQNLESFWKLIKKYNINKIPDNELPARIKRLSLLLNIFTNLYEATQLQKPIESMIDGIVDILQKPYLKNFKSYRDESRFEPNVFGHETERECLRKCGLIHSKPHLDSIGAYLSETDGRKPSDNLELEGYLDLQRRHKGNSDDPNVRVNLPSSGPSLNQVTYSGQPITILRNRFVFPNNVNNARHLMGVPDKYNVRSSVATPNLKVVTRGDNTFEDPLLNNKILASAETGEIKDLPWTIEDKSTNKLPKRIEDKTNDDIPWPIEDKTIDDLPWTIKHKSTAKLPWRIEDKTNDDKEDKTIDGLPWTIEDESSDNLPWTIENKTTDGTPSTIEDKFTDNVLWTNKNKSTDNIPWTIEGKTTKNVPWTIDDRKTTDNIPWSIKNRVTESMPWTIEDKTNDNLPWTMKHKTLNKVPVIIEDRPTHNLPWTIEDRSTDNLPWTTVNKKGHLPITLYQSSGPNLTTDDGKIRRPLGKNQTHLSSTVKIFRKPYHIYTYIINPSSKRLYKKSKTGKLLEVKSEQYNNNLGTKFVDPYGLSTSQDKNKVVYINEPSSSYYRSELSLSKDPSIKLSSHPSNSQSKNKNNVDLTISDIRQELNPIDLLLKKPQHNHQSKYINGLEKTTILLLNENDVPTVPEPISDLGVPLSNVSSASIELLNLNIIKDEPVSTASAQSDIGIYPETEPNYYDSNIKQNLVKRGDLHASFILKALYQPKYTKLANIYNKPTVAYGGQTDKHPGLIPKAPYSKYTQSASNYNTPTLIYGGKTHNHPFRIPKALSYYPEYTKLAKLLVSGTETDNTLNFLGFNHPYEHVQFIEKPNLIKYLPYPLNYLKHLKPKLTPTYQLFALENLIKLQDALARAMQINTLKNHESRALANLRKIINILLILANHLGETETSNEWYKNIFYNVRQRRHPLHRYAYNLIRQRWLHELMLLLYNNNFNLNILHTPRICSFLGAWRFPNYVRRILEIEEVLHDNFDGPNAFEHTSSTQNVILNNVATQTHHILEETPDDIRKYMIKNVLKNYRDPNEGIVVSIAGVDAEPDANAIIEILQKYLQKESYIEKQENVIIRDNKTEMLNQIIIFLKEKGYNPNIIAGLIHKLYSVLYSAEGKRCPTAHREPMQNVYDVILPVLRSSKQ